MFTKISNGIESILTVLLLITLTLMVVSICTQVVGRYAFDHSPAWTEEAARMSMAWITMLGSALVIRRQGHISISVLVDACPPALAKGLLMIRDALILVMAGGMAWYGWGFAVVGGRRSSAALEISMFYPYLAIPVGFALIGLLLLLHYGEKLTGQVSDATEKLTGEASDATETEAVR